MRFVGWSEPRRLIGRLKARPEFGPFVLLVAVELCVFWAINHAFLSPAEHQQHLAFTVELGLIALAMTLLMTSGEFDLSVGSVFGFSPVLMWTLATTAACCSLRWRSSSRWRGAALIGLVNGWFVTSAEDPVLPGHARHAAGGARDRPVHHRRLPAAHLERRRQLARQLLVGDFYVGGFRIYMLAVLVRRRRSRAGLRADRRPSFGNWIQAVGRQRGAARARGVNVDRTKTGLFVLSSVLAALGRASSARSAPRRPTRTAAPATSSRSSPWW